MWAVIGSVLSIISAIAMPFIANWVQDKARERKEEEARRQREEEDLKLNRKLEAQEAKLMRTINERVADAQTNLRKEMDRLRQGD